MEIVIDTSAIIAAIADEPDGDKDKMLVFDISDFTKDTARVFNAAKNNEVIIKSDDGNNYKLSPMPKGKSPFDGVPRIKLGLTTQEIVEIVRESRASVL